MKIIEISETKFRVESDSGNIYTVRYVSGDPDGYDENINLWECDCPAGQYGRDCKHLKAVNDVSGYLTDSWPIDEIEQATGHIVIAGVLA